MCGNTCTAIYTHTHISQKICVAHLWFILHFSRDNFMTCKGIGSLLPAEVLLNVCSSGSNIAWIQVLPYLHGFNGMYVCSATKLLRLIGISNASCDFFSFYWLACSRSFMVFAFVGRWKFMRPQINVYPGDKYVCAPTAFAYVYQRCVSNNKFSCNARNRYAAASRLPVAVAAVWHFWETWNSVMAAGKVCQLTAL